MIDADHQATLLRWLADASAEVCAFLLSSAAGAQSLLRVDNIAIGRREFHVASSEIERARRFAEVRGLRIVAFIHSHRDETSLSPADEAAFRRSPWPWVVVTVRDGALVQRWHPIAR